MDLGKFSISLNVKDIEISRDFYQKLGFEIIDGKIEEKWLILKNGAAIIGLFQDMFEKNIITFIPSDVRSIQKELKKTDVKLAQEADENTSGAAHITLEDPDGNSILMDQH